ncbi:hypothetical protein BVG16_01165 [Paenibacillus selenitireducens]|uniref:Uncharacterized protein n=1 Tax=Paenibacillus selenitireducens TaxID=1324314 RepID=A0A1T2XMF0_9BACL|nr:hypothetical protein [Paenibacillus selenitireducens]OPA80988.1 hypothetical protein BVG16_01165 [Paenibacillus selenitireducens]
MHWNGAIVVERTVRRLASEAAAHFKKTAAALVEMREMFPFPQGGQPDEPTAANRAVELLRAAREAEEQGIQVLEGLLDFMKAYWSEQWVN